MLIDIVNALQQALFSKLAATVALVLAYMVLCQALSAALLARLRYCCERSVLLSKHWF